MKTTKHPQEFLPVHEPPPPPPERAMITPRIPPALKAEALACAKILGCNLNDFAEGALRAFCASVRENARRGQR